jgi:Fe-S cluster assembly ATP-binding protein
LVKLHSLNAVHCQVLVGHPDYDVTGGSAIFKGKKLFELEPEERSHAGLFLSFQSPVEVPGVSNTDFLRMAHNARRQSQGLKELDPLEVSTIALC